MSGLPGGGFGVNSLGNPDTNGAIAISTPIAYSLSNWSVVLGGSIVSHNSKFEFLRHNKDDFVNGGNGTAQFMVGIPLNRFGSLTASFMALSGVGDNAFNFHYTPPGMTGPVQVGFGVQDIRGNGGSAGASFPSDKESSTSVYAVGTYKAPHDSYVSLGVGTRRFSPVFGSASVGVIPGVKGVLEYDSFNWNYGVSLGLDRIFGYKETDGEYRRHFQPTIFLGAIRGKYAYWSVNFAF